MGKKNKDQEPVANLSSVANRDIIQRINFLYQASTYLNSISQALPSSSEDVKPERPPPVTKGKSKKKQKLRHPSNTAELSRSYIGTMRTVGQKAMVRMDPSIKRTLCKGCDTVLLPGSTATVRVHPMRSHGHVVVYTCSTCNTSRRIPAPPMIDPDMPPSEETATTESASASQQAGMEDPSAMDVDPLSANPPVSVCRPKDKRKRNEVKPRIPPLFERKGHVVFRGNERLPDEEPTTQE